MPIFLTIAALGASCDRSDGVGYARGAFAIPSCNLEREDFGLDIDFFTAAYIDDTLTIRMQNSALPQGDADGIVIEVRNTSLVAENLGAPLAIELFPTIEEFKENGPSPATGDDAGVPITTNNSPVRAALFLHDTCPDENLAFGDGAGEVTFEHIYVPGGPERITGSFDLEFLNPRSWKSPDDIDEHVLLQGELDFKYSRTKPGQTFI